VLETRLHVCKIHATEVVKKWTDLGLVGSKAGMDVRVFPHCAICSGLSQLLATNHAKCMYNELQTAQLKKVVGLFIRDKATGQIVILDGVELFHMQEGQTWLKRR